MRRRVTIDDISRYTGLSRGTVSRAMNDRPDVSERTRARVLEACRALRYVPSRAARSLTTGRSDAVVALVGDLRAPFAVACLRGVLRQADRLRYAVYVTEQGDDPAGAQERIIELTGDRIDGLLVAGQVEGRLCAQLCEAAGQRPLVVCCRAEGVRCDTYLPDHPEAGRLVARCLLSHGRRHLLYLHRLGDAEAAERLAGFRRVCADAGITPTILAAADDTATVEQHVAGLREADGIAASDDRLAIAALWACARLGRTPGVEVLLLGQGNTPACEVLPWPLTSVDFGGEEIGQRAMETLVARINGRRVGAASVTHVAPRLMERATTGAARP